MHCRGNLAARLIKLAEEAAAAPDSEEVLLPYLARTVLDRGWAAGAFDPKHPTVSAFRTARVLSELSQFRGRYSNNADDIYNNLYYSADDYTSDSSQSPLRRYGDALFLSVEVPPDSWEGGRPETWHIPLTPSSVVDWLAQFDAMTSQLPPELRSRLPQDPIERIRLAVKAQHRALYEAKQRAKQLRPGDEATWNPAGVDYAEKLGRVMPLSSAIRLSVAGARASIPETYQIGGQKFKVPRLPVGQAHWLAQRYPHIFASDKLANSLIPALRRVAATGQPDAVLSLMLTPKEGEKAAFPFSFPTDPFSLAGVYRALRSSTDPAQTAKQLLQQFERPDRRYDWNDALGKLYKENPQLAADIDLLGKSRVAWRVNRFLVPPESPGAALYAPWLAINEGEALEKAGPTLLYRNTPPNWRLVRKQPNNNADLAVATNSAIPAVEFWKRTMLFPGAPDLESTDLLSMMRYYHRMMDHRFKQQQTDEINRLLPIDTNSTWDNAVGVAGRMALTRTSPDGYVLYNPESISGRPLWSRAFDHKSVGDFLADLVHGGTAWAETLSFANPRTQLLYSGPHNIARLASGDEVGRQGPLLSALSGPAHLFGVQLRPIGVTDKELPIQPESSPTTRGLDYANLRAADAWMKGLDRKGYAGRVFSESMGSFAGYNPYRTAVMGKLIKGVGLVPGMKGFGHVGEALDTFSRTPMNIPMTLARSAIRQAPVRRYGTVGKVLDDVAERIEAWGDTRGPIGRTLSRFASSGVHMAPDLPFFAGLGAGGGIRQGVAKWMTGQAPSLSRSVLGGAARGAGGELINLGILSGSGPVAETGLEVLDWARGKTRRPVTRQDVERAREDINFVKQLLEAKRRGAWWYPTAPGWEQQQQRQLESMRNFVERYDPVLPKETAK